MNLKKTNEIFGYALFTIGALKILLIILVLLKLTTNLNSIVNGENVNSDYYPTLSTTIGAAQIILAVGSIIMIIVNIKKQPEVITGYLWGLGALLIEFITPSIISFYAIFVECCMYMKAGNKIRNKNSISSIEHKTSKKIIKNTEWFYSDQNEENEEMEIKKRKRIEKLEEEIYGWKQLLDLGQIDEATYNEETSKLIEKEKRRSEREKRY